MFYHKANDVYILNDENVSETSAAQKLLIENIQLRERKHEMYDNYERLEEKLVT